MSRVKLDIRVPDFPKLLEGFERSMDKALRAAMHEITREVMAPLPLLCAIYHATENIDRRLSSGPLGYATSHVRPVRKRLWPRPSKKQRDRILRAINQRRER